MPGWFQDYKWSILTGRGWYASCSWKYKEWFIQTLWSCIITIQHLSTTCKKWSSNKVCKPRVCYGEGVHAYPDFPVQCFPILLSWRLEHFPVLLVLEIPLEDGEQYENVAQIHSSDLSKDVYWLFRHFGNYPLTLPLGLSSSGFWGEGDPSLGG